ncbi:protein of unknown function (plasmid) [Ralstonia solanacearum PSI07]|nr:protein of unknown function [Ralstonia solanacearum PSI07]
MANRRHSRYSAGFNADGRFSVRLLFRILNNRGVIRNMSIEGRESRVT